MLPVYPILSGTMMSGVVFFKARSGALSASVDAITLHSRFNPVKEAERFAAQVDESSPVIILEGLGLGYIAEAFLRQNPHRPVIVAESDNRWPKRAAAARDLTGLFRNPQLTIFCGENPQGIVNLLKEMKIQQNLTLLPWRPSVKLNPNWYSSLENHIRFYLQRQAVNRKTLDRFGELWIRNISANLPILARAIPLEGWEGRFSGIPALVIAGGPSLDDYLPCISALRESHLLIAVDTAMTALRRVNVKPDIIAAVDPQYWNIRHLDRCREAVGEALILSEIAAHPVIFRSLDGRPWLTRTHFPLAGKLEDTAGIYGRLRAGGSVATAAWDLGRFLGCVPICALGLDLGFPGGRTHYSGSLSQSLPHLSAGRTTSAEGFFYHLLHNPQTHPVEAMDGSSLITDTRMDIYAAWFAENSPPARKPCVLGRRGRHIEGIEPKTVEELLQSPPRRREINRNLEEIKKTQPKKDVSHRLVQTLEGILTCLELLHLLAAEGQNLAEKGAGMSPDAQNSKHATLLLKRLKTIDEKMLGMEGREIVSFLIQPIIREIESETSAERGWIATMKKSASLYRQIAESATRQIRYLKPAANRMLQA